MTKTFTLASLIVICFSLLAQAQNNEQSKSTKEILPAEVNTTYLEARPLISGDGTTLFFNRRFYQDNIGGVKDFQDIYVSRYDSATNAWTTATNIGRVLNNKDRNAVASVNENGTEGIFFNTYKDPKRAPLVRSKKTAKGWSLPVPITIQNFVNVNDYADYHLSFKHNVLLLAVEGDLTQGQQDLYVSLPDGYGNWKEPINLGPVINSRESDFSPFLGSDGRSLFFSSYGHESMGGSDIFMSIRLDDTWLRWSTPVNLGPQINTNHEESYFSITDDFKYIYYTSNTIREPNRDIIRVELPDDFTAINGPLMAKLDSAAIRNIMLSGDYKVSQTGAQRNFQGVAFDGWPGNDEPVQPAETLTDAATNPDTVRSADANTPTSGSANTTNARVAAVPRGETSRYAGFKPVREVTDLSSEAEKLKLYLQQKLPNQEFLVRQNGNNVEFKIVQNLEYDFNSVYVTPDYLPRLRNIGNLLRERSDLQLQLIGHTDEVGSPETNERVARQRVDNLEDYFKRRGIADSRLEVIGAGNSEPLAANDTEANRVKNRRVEIIIQMNK